MQKVKMIHSSLNIPLGLKVLNDIHFKMLENMLFEILFNFIKKLAKRSNNDNE